MIIQNILSAEFASSMMFTNVILVISACVVIHYLISYYRKRLGMIRTGNALPGPKTLPVFGNADVFYKWTSEEFLHGIYSLTNTYPSPSRIWMINRLLLIVSEPDQVKAIVQSSSSLNKNIFYNLLDTWLGTGLITAPESIWIRHRKMIAPSFNTNILRVFCDTFVKQALIFTDKLEHMVGDKVDLSHHIATCTLDIIYDTVLGTELGSQSNQHLYVMALDKLKEIFIYRSRNIFLFPDFIFNLTSLSRVQRKYLNVIYSSAKKVIQQKENARNDSDPTEDEGSEPSNRTFLNILMGASNKDKKFTRKNLLDEINTIFFAGSDTTAGTMNFIIFMLANFPEVQEKVYEELLNIYGTQDPKSAPLQFNDLQHMKYLERVIKETMRLFPIVPIIGRTLNQDLQIGEYTLAKGTEVALIILKLHRNEKYWPNALTFDPDRFLPENMANIHPYSYIPFSGGPRNCIGLKYAMISMKVMLATLLRRYILKVDKQINIDEIKLKMDITLGSIDPLKVRIEHRY